jgi:DNA-binding NarL/FixJ family response regulator
MDILIADDSDLILMRLKDQLNACKDIRIVGMFRNGTDALNHMLHIKPDVAIIDIELPDLNGFEILREIRKVNGDIKIIVLTLLSSDFYRKRAKQLGSDYFFSKTDQFQEVLGAITSMITEKQQNHIKI